MAAVPGGVVVVSDASGRDTWNAIRGLEEPWREFTRLNPVVSYLSYGWSFKNTEGDTESAQPRGSSPQTSEIRAQAYSL